MSKHTKNQPLCCEWIDGVRCDRISKCFGRCAQHYAALKHENAAEIIRLHRLSFAERQAEYEKTRLGSPIAPKPWEYEPSEQATQELIAQCGGNDNE